MARLDKEIVVFSCQAGADGCFSGRRLWSGKPEATHQDQERGETAPQCYRGHCIVRGVHFLSGGYRSWLGYSFILRNASRKMRMALHATARQNRHHA
jgi:hypothetical protein